MTANWKSVLGAGVIGALSIVSFSASAPAQGTTSEAPVQCDRELLGKIAGSYRGENLGFSSVLEVAGHDGEACRVDARWETLNERAPVSGGTLELTLEDGVLKGEWRAGEQSGRARFDVLREGRLLNGRMIGLKDEPSGSWDYQKAP